MIKKKFLKNKCRIEFIFQSDTEDLPETVSLVGDFNDWDEAKSLLTRRKNDFYIRLELPLEQEFQFRYLVNGTDWYNDPEADNMINNPFGSDNCIISTRPQPEAVS